MEASTAVLKIGTEAASLMEALEVEAEEAADLLEIAVYCQYADGTESFKVVQWRFGERLVLSPMEACSEFLEAASLAVRTQRYSQEAGE